jgi:NADPH-dependent 2,4-dienoyl-CoA reductase/sulfur reductase-like enzyme
MEDRGDVHVRDPRPSILDPRSPYDVAVIGGGPAGVAAAVVAAKRGARVVLLDRADRLGGSVVAALHRCLCGLYAAEPKSPVDTLNDGVQRQVVDRLVRKAPTDVRVKSFGNAWVLEFPAAAYVAVLTDICRDAGVDVCAGTTLGAVQLKDGRIDVAQSFLPVFPPCSLLKNPGGDTGKNDCATKRDIRAKVFVDCTGIGQVVTLADAALPADDGMLAGYGIRLANVDGDPDLLRLQVPYFLKRAVDAGTLHPLARFTVFHPGPGPAEGVCKLAIDAARFSEAEVSDFATTVVACLKANIETLKGAMVTETSPHAMPRSGRRLAGRYVMSEKDILSPLKMGHEESVLAWWPIEQWDAAAGPTYRFAEPGQPYAIPMTALQSNGVDNLLAGGMCIAATPTAAASIRASGICLATGDLAGRLAAKIAGF